MENDIKMMKEDYIREIIKFYREKGISKESVEMLDTMIHSAKNLCKIYEACEEENYSMRGDMSYAPYSMNSYARGRGSNASRDSMGRYSSMGGYSGHDDMIANLHNLMNRTSDENTRRELQDMINRM